MSLLFLALGTNPTIRAHIRPEAVERMIEGLGWKGPFLLGIFGVLSPVLFLPRWPIAVVAGLVYGVFWGTCLANTASLAGAWLQYLLAHSMLADLAERWLSRYPWRRALTGKRMGFWAIFLVRAFPLSNFVATNLVCGTLRIPLRTYLAASALGMIPSTVLYASWGKLTIRPSGGFVSLALAALIVIVAVSFLARRVLGCDSKPVIAPSR